MSSMPSTSAAAFAVELPTDDGSGARSANAASRPVLILVSRLPFPLDDGWKTRTYHVIHEIAAAYPTTVLVRVDDKQLPHVEAFRATLPRGTRLEMVVEPDARIMPLVKAAFGRTPIYVHRMQTPLFMAKAFALAKEQRFSSCVCVYTYVFPIGRAHELAEQVFVDTHNIDSQLMERYATALPFSPRRLFALRTAQQLHLWEAKVFREAKGAWVCSDDEKRMLAASGFQNSTVAANGIQAASLDAVRRAPIAGRILFFGRLDYFPNADAVERLRTGIVPRVREQLPNTTVRIVGAGRIAESWKTEMAGVEIVGAVDDVRTELATADICVVPLRVGSGTRLKVLEALGAGVPIVATALAVEGLGLTPGKHYIAAETDEELANAAVALLPDSARKASLSEEGRLAVMTAYQWSATLNPITDALSRTSP